MNIHINAVSPIYTYSSQSFHTFRFPDDNLCTVKPIVSGTWNTGNSSLTKNVYSLEDTNFKYLHEMKPVENDKNSVPSHSVMGSFHCI